MTTQFFKRPSSAYTGEAGLPNRTKYNDDSTASPRRPISSTKVDGDFNYLIDAVNTLYDTAVSGVVADNSITDAKLRDSAGLSVIGRSANSTGNPADIVAANDGEVLRRSGTSIGFGQAGTSGIADLAVTTPKIADTNVTFAKIQNVNTATILGRSSSGAGSVEALTAGTGLTVTGGAVAAVDASDTVKGVVELATTAETQTGTDTVRAVTPAGLKGAIGFSNRYESAAQSYSNGGSAVLTHGLGGRPTLYQVTAVCQTGEHGYLAGAELLLPAGDGNNANVGISVWGDTTSFTYRVGTGGIGALNAGTGAQVILTPANWRLVLRAWI